MDKRIHGIRQITRNPFLNFYEFDTEDRKGARHPYYVASRAADTAGLLACAPDAPEGEARLRRRHSTVTDLARLRGWSMGSPRSLAT